MHSFKRERFSIDQINKGKRLNESHCILSLRITKMEASQ